MRTAITVGLILLLFLGAGALYWMGGTPRWLRPDFQAARDDIETKTRELESTQAAVIGLTKQLQVVKAEADQERQRARDLSETVVARASEVGRLQARLRDLQVAPRLSAPHTLQEAASALVALGY